jgi:phage baseplate assembly protein W
MAGAVRYRAGINAQTGKVLVGQAHLRQSLSIIWTTRFDTVLMDLDLGNNVRDRLGEDITPALALDIYDDLITAAHAQEPEFRVMTIRFVRFTATGILGLAYGGVYFPEGRFGNYDIAEFIDNAPISLERASRALAA